MSKKLLSVLLILSMVFSLIPGVRAQAAMTPEKPAYIAGEFEYRIMGETGNVRTAKGVLENNTDIYVTVEDAAARDGNVLALRGSDAGIDTAGFMSLVFGWIHDHIAPASKTCTRYSSYSLKHMVEDDIGYYITNNQFKDAMLLCGYQPVNANQANWLFRIKLNRNNLIEGEEAR